ncbi:MAG: ribonuclease HI [Chlorobi bacterium]|nr:ribonuclease HI [Chlorobiota bacterium]
MKHSNNEKNCQIIIYTDGAAIGNPGPAAYAALLRYICNGKVIAEKEISGGFSKSTNNRAELWAVVKALEAVKKHNIPVIVVSDSKYIVDSVNNNWLIKWEAENWKQRPNADLWKTLLQQIKKIHNISFQWTKGHASNELNNRVDKIANSLAQKIKSGEFNAPPDPGFVEMRKMF